MAHLCIVCGLPLEDRRPHAKYHKGECTREIWRRQSRKKAARKNGDQGWREPRPCSECGKPFEPRTPKQETCGENPCVQKRKRKMEKLRAQGIYQRDQANNVFGEYKMHDPWPNMGTLPPGCRSWYQAEMMPVL